MKFSIVTLGCPKNEVDSEFYAKKLTEKGHKLTTLKDAEFVILNTCAFIKDAISESLETYNELKKQFGEDRIILTGCLVERLKHNIKARFIRPDDIEDIEKIFSQTYSPSFIHKQKLLYNGERLPLSALPYAYIKIQEGCSRKCTFCTIPSIRGKPRYRSIESVIDEARKLAKEGKREIILVGEDLTLYKDLIPLLKALNRINHIKLIRLLYLHPQGIKRDLLLFVKDNPKIARYFHIPIQHASEKVLRLMGRAGGERAVKKSIELVRSILPEAFIRTEIMVGFPEETETDFNTLLKFLEEYHIERIGVFMYSREEGTKSFSMPQIEEEIKKERYERASLLASLLMEKAQKKLHNKKIRLIADTEYTGRTEFDAPSSDFVVRFEKPQEIGAIFKKIVKYTGELELFA